MATGTLTPATEGAIWARIIEPESGNLTPAAAREFLEFDFRPRDRKRMDKLAEKARNGKLTPRERVDAESYNRVAHLLALLQSKARISLRRTAKSR